MKSYAGKRTKPAAPIGSANARKFTISSFSKKKSFPKSAPMFKASWPR